MAAVGVNGGLVGIHQKIRLVEHSGAYVWLLLGGAFVGHLRLEVAYLRLNDALNE